MIETTRAPRLATSADGYCTFAGVFDGAEVELMRARLLDAFEGVPERVGDDRGHPNGRDVRVDLFRYPTIYPRVFTPRVIATLQTIARSWSDDGAFVLYPGHSFHRNGFGASIADWHKDTDSMERAGWNFHWHAGYAPVHCAIYLQDATVEYGGGLCVIPGSHRIPNPFGMLDTPELRAYWYADKTIVMIPSRAGDMVCFDTKIDHYATHRTLPGCPPYGDKLAIFFSIAPPDHFAATFSRFLHTRPSYAYLRECVIPDDMRELARAHNFDFQL